jgi:uncharacterized protein (UPF0305 family)
MDWWSKFLQKRYKAGVAEDYHDLQKTVRELKAVAVDLRETTAEFEEYVKELKQAREEKLGLKSKKKSGE